MITEEKIGEIHSAIKSNSDITLQELIEKLLLPIKKSQLSRWNFNKELFAEYIRTFP